LDFHGIKHVEGIHAPVNYRRFENPIGQRHTGYIADEMTHGSQNPYFPSVFQQKVEH
jgi:hypothetical protein